MAAAGIALSGNDLQAAGNRIIGFGEANAIQGIRVGDFKQQFWDVAVVRNRITDCRAGVLAGRVTEMEISDNHISAAAQAASATAGIGLILCSATEVHNNDIRDVSSALIVGGGRFNRLSGNDLSGCGNGIWVGSEALPEITDNRIRDMQSFRIAVDKINLSCAVKGNHLDRCGYGERQAFGLVATSVAGELTVNGNEIRDIGLDPNYKSTSTTAFGILGYLILTATVSDNFVTYSNILARPTAAEDRALYLLGMTSILIKNKIVGFPAIVTNNKFYGAGRSALIEIQLFATGANYVGFDRVTFSNNYCFHSTDQRSDALATVNLKGNFGIAMGNHIQAADPFASFDFNNMKGPVIGNVMAGGVLNHPGFPGAVRPAQYVPRLGDPRRRMMEELERLLKAQTEWFKKVSRDVAGKAAGATGDLAERMRKEAVAASRARIEALEAQQATFLKRVEAAIDAEKAVIERLDVAGTKGKSKGKPKAARAAAAPKAAKPRARPAAKSAAKAAKKPRRT